MELKTGPKALKLIFSCLCLTFFVASTAVADTSQDETLQNVLTTIRANGNPNSTAFADRIEGLIEAGELHIQIENNSTQMAGSTEACGWVNPNEGVLDQLHLSNSEHCAPVLHVAFIHEYEHLRIYREEALPTLFNFTKKHAAINKADIPQKEMDLLQGYLQYGLKMKGKVDFTDVEKNSFHTYLLFRIYTESKAYITTRAHIGNFITHGTSDTEVIDTLGRYYVGALLPANVLSNLVTQAIAARDYDGYIQRTMPLRTPELILKNLNISAPLL